MTVFDPQICTLGEGPLWHPERETLFWFDILQKRLMARHGAEKREWQFDEYFSAAGWVDHDTLLLASETALWRFGIETGEKEVICPLDADNPLTRSNDGRADPWGGFWIGTMGKRHEPGVAGIYRYYQGTLRQLVSGITVSNSICFAPDKSCAYYADTPSMQVMRQPLDPNTGWPDGPAEVFADLRTRKLYPDGAVTDANGALWIAVWGSGCVISLDPQGEEIKRLALPAKQATCPAFIGPELRDMIVTSAAIGLDAAEIDQRPLNGATFIWQDVALGRAEPRVIL